MTKCCGCYPIYQANQEGHMGPGGCMEIKEEEELFCEPVSIETIKPLSISNVQNCNKTENPKEETECCICYEMIGEKNNCVTECGHKFCLKCLVTSLTHNVGCPYCRSPIIEISEDNDDDDDSYHDSEDESESDDEDDEYNVRETPGHIEDVVDRLVKQGITMLDIVSLYCCKFSKTDEKYTNEYIRKLADTVSDINTSVENESSEMENMGREDNNVTFTLLIED